MSQLLRLLPAENILLDLQATSKKRVFESVGLLFENNQGIARSTVFESLFAREKLGSTGLGHGVAVPHGRIKNLKEAKAAFVRLAAPVPFESPDGKPVSMFFVLLVPEHATELHLQILSELAELFSNSACREALRQATSVEQVLQLFSPERVPA
ncbi:PTS IIA-like nitrogen regulatory protein PtsN [uncultured Propionivibrio sp.]|uniref:PTS IIA-like nitrogen regulatory protein PtsN n=1 Tax=uncultured Propionivibrio sp. TaxID=426737 RepID=UPI0029BFDD38|nr:PTS IIA-like nitrogen regulatory protein PtsN [uncultured Propionivibrio sp.]